MVYASQDRTRECAAQSAIDAHAGHKRVESWWVRCVTCPASVCGPISGCLCVLIGILTVQLWINPFSAMGSVSRGPVTAAIVPQKTAIAGAIKPSGDQIVDLVYELNWEDAFLAASSRTALFHDVEVVPSLAYPRARSASMTGAGDIISIRADRGFNETFAYEVSHARTWEAQLEDEIHNEAYMLAQARSHTESAMRAPREPPVLSQGINRARALINPSGYILIQTGHHYSALFFTPEHSRFLCDRTRSGSVPAHYFSIRNGYIPDSHTGAFS